LFQAGSLTRPLHVVQKLLELDKNAPDDSWGDVCAAFWKQDKFTLVLFGLIIALNELIHFCTETYAHDLIESTKYFHMISFGVALTFGYAGQRLIYSWLGKAETFLDKKVSDKLQ